MKVTAALAERWKWIVVPAAREASAVGPTGVVYWATAKLAGANRKALILGRTGGLVTGAAGAVTGVGAGCSCVFAATT